MNSELKSEIDKTTIREIESIRLITRDYENAIVSRELYQRTVKEQNEIIELCKKIAKIHE